MAYSIVIDEGRLNYLCPTSSQPRSDKSNKPHQYYVASNHNYFVSTLFPKHNQSDQTAHLMNLFGFYGLISDHYINDTLIQWLQPLQHRLIEHAIAAKSASPSPTWILNSSPKSKCLLIHRLRDQLRTHVTIDEYDSRLITTPKPQQTRLGFCTLNHQIILGHYYSVRPKQYRINICPIHCISWATL